MGQGGRRRKQNFQSYNSSSGSWNVSVRVLASQWHFQSLITNSIITWFELLLPILGWGCSCPMVGTGLWIKRSGFQAWLGCCVVFLGKSLYFNSAPQLRSLNVYWQIDEEVWWNVGGRGEGGSLVMVVIDWHPIQGGELVLLITSSIINWDKLQLDGPLSWNSDKFLETNCAAARVEN